MTPVNIALDIYNIFLGIILIISIIIRRYSATRQQIWIKWLVISNIILAASHVCYLIFKSKIGITNHIISSIAIFIMYSAVFAIIDITVIVFVVYLNQKRFKKTLTISLLVITIIYSLFLIATPFTGAYYVLNENNSIDYGPFIFVPYSLQGIIYFLLIIYVLANRKSLNIRRLIVVISFVLFPQLSQIIQLINRDLYIITTGYSITFLVMVIFENYRLEADLDYTEVELDEKENELKEKLSEIEHSKLAVIKMQNHTIESLSNLVENRDEDTGEHVRRTRAYVELLAVQLMKNNHYPEILNPRYIRFLKRAAPMHDIGKIVVPDAILKKPGALTEAEFAQMKLHASEGGRIVHEILDGYEDPEYIEITADIAKYHHEKWDGSGYPDNLKGSEIPLCARIMAIADVFDALVSPRVYKSPMTYEEAFKIISEESGIHFDPIIANEFLKIKEKAASINESFKDSGY